MYSLHLDCFPLSMKYSIPLNKSTQVWFWKKKNTILAFIPLLMWGSQLSRWPQLHSLKEQTKSSFS